MNSLDVAAYTKWWNNKTKKSLSSIYHIVLVTLTVPNIEILLFYFQYTCASVHSVILCTLQSDSWAQGHSVGRRWLLYGRSPPESTSQLLGTVRERSTRPIHNYVPSTYCISKCMSIVLCHSHLYTFHTVCLLDLVAHTWTYLVGTNYLVTEYRRHSQQK